MIAAKQANTELLIFREDYIELKTRHLTGTFSPAVQPAIEAMAYEGRRLADAATAANDHLLSMVIGPERVDIPNWFMSGIR